jgi:hypothetical protein
VQRKPPALLLRVCLCDQIIKIYSPYSLIKHILCLILKFLIV